MARSEVYYETILFPVSEGNPRNSEASMIALDDGRLLLAWSEFYGGVNDVAPAHIAAVTSSDGGRTWGEKYILKENVAAMNVYGPAFLRLSSGVLAHFYYHQDSVTQLQQYLRWSHDEAQTWSDEQLITPDRVVQFMVNDHAVQLSTGRIVLPISWCRDRSETNRTFRSYCWFSDDDGATWQPGRDQIELPKSGAMEPVVVERRDGSLLMLIRTEFGDQYRAESHDGGDTWTPARPAELVSAIAPANVKRIPSTGDILLIWNHCMNPNRAHFGRTPLTAALSRDDGDTWANLRDIEIDPERGFSYPSILFHGDEVLLTYYQSHPPYTEAGEGSREQWMLKLKILPINWFYE